MRVPAKRRKGRSLSRKVTSLSVGCVAILASGQTLLAEDGRPFSTSGDSWRDGTAQVAASPAGGWDPAYAGAAPLPASSGWRSADRPSAGQRFSWDATYPQLQIAQATPSEPEDGAPPEVSVISERGGVLTPRGTFVLEPSLEYTKASSNRLNFRGISIVEGFLIGAIDSIDADRDSVTAALSARYGITDRLEVELKVPYLRRDDRVETTTGAGTVENNITSSGLGDIEAAAHYQINDGANGWPFFVANLRYKSNTGDGPFDVTRDADGIPTELATGSGFHSVEPSVTALYPTDPAVLFANISYLYTLEDSVDTTVGTQFIQDVDPGDSVGFSFGVGFALNEELSLSLGYQHDFVFETETEIQGIGTDKSDEFSVGSFLVGGSFRVHDRVGINLTTQFGATDDAPDVQVVLRVPIRF